MSNPRGDGGNKKTIRIHIRELPPQYMREKLPETISEADLPRINDETPFQTDYKYTAAEEKYMQARYAAEGFFTYPKESLDLSQLSEAFCNHFEERFKNSVIPKISQGYKPTMFCTSAIPSISIKNYLERIIRYTGIVMVRDNPGNICIKEYTDIEMDNPGNTKNVKGKITLYEANYVLILCYLDTFIQNNPTFYLNHLNIHRLLLTCAMVVAKFANDHYYNNAHYAKVGGVPTIEINLLEMEFLAGINFELFVTQEKYNKYYGEVRKILNDHLASQTQSTDNTHMLGPR